MSELSVVSTRIPTSWLDKIRQQAASKGEKESQVFRSAIAQYLEMPEAENVTDAISSLSERLLIMEKKLSNLGQALS